MAGRLPKWIPPYLFELVPVILLASLALLVAYPRWRAEIDWRDEGLLAYGAVRVAGGEIPHRDFVSVQPPLSYYTTAAVFRLFGTSLTSLRGLGLTIFLLLPVLLYGVARMLKLGLVASLCAAAPTCILGLPYVYFVPLAAWQGITASFSAVLLLLAGFVTRHRWLAVPAGILTAASGLLRQDQAIYTVVAIVFFIVAVSFAHDDSVGKIELRRPVLLWLLGIAVVTVPFLIIWWAIGAVPETFKQLVVFPFATYRKTSALPFPKWTAGTSLPERLVAFLFYLPVVVQGLAALLLGYRLWRRRLGFREAVLVFLVTWSALFYLQVLVRSDQTHLLLTLFPFFLLAAYLAIIAQRAVTARRLLALIVPGIFVIIAGSYLWLIRSILLPDVSHATEPLTLERAGVRVTQARMTNTFVKTLQTYVPPNQSMLALPYQPMFYFLADRRNPTRWNYLWPGDQTAQDHQLFVQQARHDPPAVILLSDEDEFATWAPLITRYVKSDYVRTAMFGRLAIYVRRDAE